MIIGTDASAIMSSDTTISKHNVSTHHDHTPSQHLRLTAHSTFDNNHHPPPPQQRLAAQSYCDSYQLRLTARFDVVVVVDVAVVRMMMERVVRRS